MMPELSLNILDIAQNSVAAGAALIEITVDADTDADRLTITVSDDGRGMTPEQAAKADDPFFTTRTTREVGLGVPFFKMAAELTGGGLGIKSVLGGGTVITAVFGYSHIDRMPLGDIAETMAALTVSGPDINFVLACSFNGAGFVADTREFRLAAGGVEVNRPGFLEYIRGRMGEIGGFA